jgi:hypothetical protein
MKELLHVVADARDKRLLEVARVRLAALVGNVTRSWLQGTEIGGRASRVASRRMPIKVESC